LHPRFGIVDSYVNPTEASAAGAGWTRVFFRWDVIQPAGPADWKPANIPDPYLDAELAAGREVVGVIVGTPAWASDNGTSTGVPPLEFWGDFVYKLAEQYKGRVNRWVIWNQPDVTAPNAAGYTWSGNEEDYYLLLKEAYSKIKAVDPSMQVQLGGLTYTWDKQQHTPQFLDRLLNIIVADQDAAANNYFFDAVSYHLYYSPTEILQMLVDVRNILTARGIGNKPIWINETNAPPSEDFIEPPQGTPVFKVSLEEQNAFIIQAFSLAMAGGAERIAINKMRNERDYPDTIVPMGLLRGDNSRRPAFDAFKTVTTYFSNMTVANWQKLDDIFIVTVDRVGETTTVLWNTARTPANFRLNAISSQALLVDEVGHSSIIDAANGVYTVELPGAICTNGDYCFIGGAPRLVVEAGSPDQRAPLSAAAAIQPAQSPAATAPPTATALPPTATVPPPPAPPPTVTPLPLPTEAIPPSPLPPAALPDTPGQPAPDMLPDTSLDPFAPEAPVLTPAAPAPTVPPVTMKNLFRPERLLWLFVIGLIVFTVAYGVQVAIWYRFKR
jgi:hypothetical protein